MFVEQYKKVVVLILLLFLSWQSDAAIIQNSASANINGISMGTANATVTLNVQSNLITSAIAEINPGELTSNSKNNQFTTEALVTLVPADIGFDKIDLIAPSGFVNVSMQTVVLNGTQLDLQCPPINLNEYCVNQSSQTSTIQLSQLIQTTSTISLGFTAEPPSVSGDYNFELLIADASSPTITPYSATAGDSNNVAEDSNNLTVIIGEALDLDNSTVQSDPQIVIADGNAASNITVSLIDINGNAVPGKSVEYVSDRGLIDTVIQPTTITDSNGVTVGSISSTTLGVSTISAREMTDDLLLTAKATVYFTQGNVLRLRKKANKRNAVIGDIITYTIQIENNNNFDVQFVKVDDNLPPNFKYIKGATTVDGVKAPDPTGNRILTFDLGTVSQLIDTNNNGRADLGEQGYKEIIYQLVVGSGAIPKDYINSARAKDVCDLCFISNQEQAKVTVELDPIFDLSTIIGKVFEDKNKNGLQDKGEHGIAGALVVLDTGVLATTDEYGRYHFPLIPPGQRLIKINLQSLGKTAITTTDEAKAVTISQGLLTKVNFGINYEYEQAAIGRKSEKGISLSSNKIDKPLNIVGQVEALSLLINGAINKVPSGQVQVSTLDVDDVVLMIGNEFKNPIIFTTSVNDLNAISSWQIFVYNSEGKLVKTLSGIKTPPKKVEWNGYTDKDKLISGGGIYQYQLVLNFTNGNQYKSERKLFGVDIDSAVQLNLTGGAFTKGSAKLSEYALKILKNTASIMRRYPNEKIIIAGFADSIGDEKFNLTLSKKRAQAAADFLIKTEKINSNQFIIKGFGEENPMVSNETEEGRAINRRIEIQGKIRDIEYPKLYEQFRAMTEVRANGNFVTVDQYGRFQTEISEQNIDELNVEITNSRGESIRASVNLPKFEILKANSAEITKYGIIQELYSVNIPSDKQSFGSNEVALHYTLIARTQPGNTIYFGEHSLVADKEGLFKLNFKLTVGKHQHELIIKDKNNLNRAFSIDLTVHDKDDKGKYLLAVKPIPFLTVSLPPKGIVITHPDMTIKGNTQYSNKVFVNDEIVIVKADGAFVHHVTLKKGFNKIKIRVEDIDGFSGEITREFELHDKKIFLMAIADGKISKLSAKGYIDGSGIDNGKNFYTEGRVAYYLKGYIAGEYLITSAFDSGTGEFNKLFTNIDKDDNDRLLTNLDPNKLYPVYGDNSSLVYDAQTRGKFYLSIESDEFNALVGSYAVNLDNTEIASYQRTLYGGIVKYNTVATTENGQSNTKLTVFGAEGQQLHVQDELQSTGGSLYYLSHDNIIEGSEQISLIVRDRNTGLTLQRTPQTQDVDYTIQYIQGHILFNRPISTYSTDTIISNNQLEFGNPVFIQVDYETFVDSFSNTVTGGQISQQINDNIKLGATFVKDQLISGEHQLVAVNTEIRVGKRSRLIGEYAESKGVDGITNVSKDGGITYVESIPQTVNDGNAWKLSGQIDWFEQPKKLTIGGYIKHFDSGFQTSNSNSENGTDKQGFHLTYLPTIKDSLLLKHDRNEFLTGSLATGASVNSNTINGTAISILQWRHIVKSWEVISEFQSRNTQFTSIQDDETQYLTSQFKYRHTDKLRSKFGLQKTLLGVDNDQATLGVEYDPSALLTLESSAAFGSFGKTVNGGARLKFGKAKFYVAEQLTEERSAELRSKTSTSTIFGSSYNFNSYTKVYSEQQWQRQINGKQKASAFGAQTQWPLSEKVVLLLSGEYSKLDKNSPSTRRYTFSSGITFNNLKGLKVLNRNEVRKDNASVDRTQFLTLNSIELKLDPDYTLLGKARYSITKDKTNDVTEARYNEYSIGIAYRPTAHDWFNALGRFTKLIDKQFSAATQPTNDIDADIASVEWSWDIHPLIEWVDKEAIKIKRESSVNNQLIESKTLLSIHRLNFHILTKLDIGLEYRILRQNLANDARKGWLTELTWKFTKHFRVGTGYNFTDFSDNEFSNNDYSVRGSFVRFKALY